MKGGKRCFLFLAVFLLAVVSSSVLLTEDASSARQEEVPLPQDTYPDADVILTVGKDGQTLVTQRSSLVDGDPDGTVSWVTRTVSPGSDVTVAEWLSTTGELRVVLDGADVRNLVLLHLDELEQTQKYIDISFRMVSGSVRTLTLFAVDNADVPALGNDYDRMFNPLGNVDIRLESGTVTEFVPTEDMVRVGEMTVTIGEGATVHRMFTTGEEGRYGSVTVLLRGGSVGYMSNTGSMIGSMSYGLEAGSVDYLCIGADTEASGNRSLSSMCTSYISGDVTVSIDSRVSIRHAIIGGGVVDAPGLLSNGQEPDPIRLKNVVIDAPGTRVMMDTCFLTEKRTSAYHFGSYRVGSTAYTTSVSHTYTTQSGSDAPVYGDGGVWDGVAVHTVGSETSVFLDTLAVLEVDGLVTVSPGGMLVITTDLELHGTIVNDGTLENNAVVEKHDNGEVVGTVSGDGFVADYIRCQNTESSISIMSSDETVVIALSSPGYLRYISAVLVNGERGLSVSVPDDIAVYGDRFLLSVSRTDDDTYRVHMDGVDERLFPLCTMVANVPFDGIHGMDVAVIYSATEGGEGIDAGEAVRSQGSLSFGVVGNGYYAVSTDGSVPVEDDGGHDTEILEIALLSAGIVVTLAIMIRLLTKRD